eukprot:m.68149 g.68149  ORF g.68149 m.68149 type:complete len:515 (-) comp16681_c0_seq1:26-1570(-)
MEETPRPHSVEEPVSGTVIKHVPPAQLHTPQTAWSDDSSNTVIKHPQPYQHQPTPHPAGAALASAAFAPRAGAGNPPLSATRRLKAWLFPSASKAAAPASARAPAPTANGEPGPRAGRFAAYAGTPAPRGTAAATPSMSWTPAAATPGSAATVIMSPATVVRRVHQYPWDVELDTDHKAAVLESRRTELQELMHAQVHLSPEGDGGKSQMQSLLDEWMALLEERNRMARLAVEEENRRVKFQALWQLRMYLEELQQSTVVKFEAEEQGLQHGLFNLLTQLREHCALHPQYALTQPQQLMQQPEPQPKATESPTAQVQGPASTTHAGHTPRPLAAFSRAVRHPLSQVESPRIAGGRRHHNILPNGSHSSKTAAPANNENEDGKVNKLGQTDTPRPDLAWRVQNEELLAHCKASPTTATLLLRSGKVAAWQHSPGCTPPVRALHARRRALSVDSDMSVWSLRLDQKFFEKSPLRAVLVERPSPSLSHARSPLTPMPELPATPSPMAPIEITPIFPR